MPSPPTKRSLYGMLTAQVATFYHCHKTKPNVVTVLVSVHATAFVCHPRLVDTRVPDHRHLVGPFFRIPRGRLLTNGRISVLENAHTVFMSIGAWDYMVDLHGDISQFHTPVV